MFINDSVKNDLHKCFGSGYLVKALLDVNKHQHDSKTFNIFLKNNSSHGYIAGTIDGVILDKVRDQLSKTLSVVFKKSGDVIKRLEWKYIVSAGHVPSYLELFVSYLQRIKTSTGVVLRKLVKLIANNLKKVWAYIKSIFKGADDITKQPELESSNFEKLQFASGPFFADVVNRLANPFLKLLQTLQFSIKNAVTGMSYGTILMTNALVNTTNKTVKTVIVDFCITTFVAISQTAELFDKSPIYMADYVKRLATSFSKYFMKIERILIAEKDTIKFNDTVGLERIGFTKKGNALVWFSNNINWLARLLKQVDFTTRTWFDSFFFSISPLLETVLGEWVHDALKYHSNKAGIETENSILTGAVHLVKNDSLDDDIREDLKHSIQNDVDFSQSILDYQNDRSDAFYGEPSSKTFKDDVEIKDMLVKCYFEMDVDETRLNRVFKNKMGYTMKEYAELSLQSKGLLRIHLLRATGSLLNNEGLFTKEIGGKTLQQLKDEYTAAVNSYNNAEKTIAEIFGKMGIRNEQETKALLERLVEQMDAQKEKNVSSVMAPSAVSLYDLSSSNQQVKQAIFFEVLNMFYKKLNEKDRLEKELQLRLALHNNRRKSVMIVLLILLGIAFHFLVGWGATKDYVLDKVWPPDHIPIPEKTEATGSWSEYFGVFNVAEKVVTKLVDGAKGVANQVGEISTVITPDWPDVWNVKSWMDRSRSITGLPRMVVPGIMLVASGRIMYGGIQMYSLLISQISSFLGDMTISDEKQFFGNRIDEMVYNVKTESKRILYNTAIDTISNYLMLIKYRTTMMSAVAKIGWSAATNPVSLLTGTHGETLTEPAFEMLKNLSLKLNMDVKELSKTYYDVLENNMEFWEQGNAKLTAQLQQKKKKRIEYYEDDEDEEEVSELELQRILKAREEQKQRLKELE